MPCKQKERAVRTDSVVFVKIFLLWKILICRPQNTSGNSSLSTYFLLNVKYPLSWPFFFNEADRTKMEGAESY